MSSYLTLFLKCDNKKYTRYLVIDGLSTYMLPKEYEVKWTIRNSEGKEKCKMGYESIRYNFRKAGIYEIEAVISIPCCDDVSISCKYILHLNGDEEVEYPMCEGSELEQLPVAMPVPVPE